MDPEAGVDTDDDDNAFRQLVPRECPWTPNTTWVTRDGLVRSRHFNAWTEHWEWGAARVPALNGNRLVVNVTLDGARTRLSVEYAILAAWRSCPAPDAVCEVVDASRGTELSNLAWRRPSAARGRRRSVSLPTGTEEWRALRYVLFDASNVPCVEYRPCDHGAWECSTRGRLRRATRRGELIVYATTRDTQGRARAWVANFGYVYVDKALAFTYGTPPPRAFQARLRHDGPVHARDVRVVASPQPLTCDALTRCLRHPRRLDPAWWEHLFRVASATPLPLVPSSFWVSVLRPEVMTAVRRHYEDATRQPCLGGPLRAIPVDAESDVPPVERFGMLRLARLYVMRLKMRDRLAAGCACELCAAIALPSEVAQRSLPSPTARAARVRHANVL